MPKSIGELALYTVEELAEILDVQERTIRTYLRDGLIQGRKLARRWYVTEDALKDYFEQPEPDQDLRSDGIRQQIWDAENDPDA
jgi:excisionase family DNA binding protein